MKVSLFAFFFGINCTKIINATYGINMVESHIFIKKPHKRTLFYEDYPLKQFSHFLSMPYTTFVVSVDQATSNLCAPHMLQVVLSDENPTTDLRKVRHDTTFYYAPFGNIYVSNNVVCMGALYNLRMYSNAKETIKDYIESFWNTHFDVSIETFLEQNRYSKRLARRQFLKEWETLTKSNKLNLYDLCLKYKIHGQCKNFKLSSCLRYPVVSIQEI